MAKRRSPRLKSNAVLAQEAAREVLEKRAALKKLLQAGSLSLAQREKALRFIQRIDELKAEMQDLGFDPKSSVLETAALMRKEALRAEAKRLNRKIRQKKGGVGVYGLGPSLKQW